MAGCGRESIASADEIAGAATCIARQLQDEFGLLA
jgi:hypothetical protein